MLFDGVKLTETLGYSGGRVVGYTQNGSGDGEVLATHDLVIEIVCHFGGPKYILRIYPVAKLNSGSTQGNSTCSCGQARQRSEGNFYIDIIDIKEAAQTKNLHAILKYDSTPHQSHDVPCHFQHLH